MNILVVSPKNRTVYNFRGDLIKEMISLGHKVFVTGPNEDDLDQLELLKVDFIQVKNEKNGTSVINDYKYYKQLKTVIKQNKIDMVFCYTIKPVIYGSLAAKKCKVKKIYPMITGIGFTFVSKSTKAKVLRFIVSLLYKKALKGVSKVIFQNEDNRDEFIKHKFVKHENCVVVNGSGVNMEKFHFTGVPENITFLMISRLLKSKGVLDYLGAAQIVKEKHPNIEFLLLGKIEQMPDAISKEELQPYLDKGIINLLPETRDINSVLNLCSVYVLPSYGEGIPRTVLEAMASKRPIITTTAPGCKDTVEDSINGFLVSVNDPEQIAEKMEFFINNAEQIETMGNASFNLCQNRFEVTKINDKMIAVFGIE